MLERIKRMQDLELSDMALDIMNKRHAQKDENYSEICYRVAKAVSKDDESFLIYYNLMRKGLFLPSSPYLVNAGISNNNMSCFVIPVEDSIEGIGKTVTDCMKIQAAYGGVGIDFSTLRPEGAEVKSMARGGSCGVVAFMKLFNTSATSIKQGGSRSGALMACLRVDHPDIMEFIKCKDNDGELSNFNISVAITDEFMEAVKNDTEFDLRFNDKVYETINAKELWDSICEHAHLRGEPGLLFIDTINKYNPNTEKLGLVASSNPCHRGSNMIMLSDVTHKTIKELAEAGDDVEVFSFNPETRWVEKKMARNPRKTGENVDIYRVTFTEGYLDVTHDHEFILANGYKCKACDLEFGMDVLCFNGNHGYCVNSVEYICTEDIYNITVDDNHNLFFALKDNKTNDIRDNSQDNRYICVANCGEATLLNNTACNLGSVNVSKMILDNKDINWELLEYTVEKAVKFLDTAYDVNNYPLEEIKRESLKSRNIGLGIMGFADMLIKMGIQYGSDRSFEVAEELMRFINFHAVITSETMGSNDYLNQGITQRKNSCVTSIAPNGTIGLMANVNGGIEPFFSIAYKRKVTNTDGTSKDHFVVIEPFVEMFSEEPYYESLLNDIVNNHGMMSQEIVTNYGIDESTRVLFITAQEVTPAQHTEMLCIFQKNVQMAVSKTINLPRNADVLDVKTVYEYAYDNNCKGLTVYRDGCRENQVLSNGKSDQVVIPPSEYDVSIIKEQMEKVTAKVVKSMALTKEFIEVNCTNEPEFWSYKRKSERPRMLSGKTWLIRTNLGKYYLTINGDDHKPLEVFATPHSNDVEGNVDAEGLCRMVSLALRSRIPLETITDQLEKVRSQSLLSLPINVKKCLEEYARASVSRKIEKDEVLFGSLCPECKNKTLIQEGGCNRCLECGFSSCG